MNVIWTPEAEQDRADIWDYIAADNPDAASDMDSRFSETAAALARHPELGMAGSIAGTRELFPHPHYRLVYEISTDNTSIWILTLISTWQMWPPVYSAD